MSKIIFLHIGPHKTGTTSVQTWAQANEKAFSKFGVYYPKVGRNLDGNHSSIAWSLSNNGRAKSDIFRDFLNEVRESTESTVLVSGEEFEYLDRQDILKLREALKDYSVKIVLTLRPQHEIIRSQYGEWIKQFLTNDDFSYFWRVHRRFQEYDFTAMILKWSEFFGLGNIVVMSLDEAKKSPSGIISEFCYLLKLPERETIAQDRRNSSDPAEVVFLWRYMLSKVQLISGVRIGLEDQTLGDHKIAVVEELRERYGSIIGQTKRMFTEGGFVQTPFKGYSNIELQEVQLGFSEVNRKLFHISGRKLWDHKSQTEDVLNYPVVPALAIRKSDELFHSILGDVTKNNPLIDGKL